VASPAASLAIPVPTPSPTAVQVPQTTVDAVSWLSSNWIGIFILAVTVFVVWRWARPIVDRLVMRALIAQERAMPTGAPEDELAKRAATLEDLANRLIRLLLVVGIVLVVFGVLDLWPAVAGMGIFLAALTLAGQSVVLDYIMGVLILLEGQYFLGDTLRVGAIEGVVEEVGLRRTVVRDAAGIVHSISNGTIRVSSNLTRIYAVAIVDIQGVRNEDVETVVALMDRVGAEMVADPDWAGVFLEPPAYSSTVAFTDLGLTMRMSSKVRPHARGTVPGGRRPRVGRGPPGSPVEWPRPRGDAGGPGWGGSRSGPSRLSLATARRRCPGSGRLACHAGHRSPSLGSIRACPPRRGFRASGWRRRR
jgi:small-conductance mechanosensitive channel